VFYVFIYNYIIVLYVQLPVLSLGPLDLLKF